MVIFHISQNSEMVNGSPDHISWCSSSCSVCKVDFTNLTWGQHLTPFDFNCLEKLFSSGGPHLNKMFLHSSHLWKFVSTQITCLHSSSHGGHKMFRSNSSHGAGGCRVPQLRPASSSGRPVRHRHQLFYTDHFHMMYSQMTPTRETYPF